MMPSMTFCAAASGVSKADSRPPMEVRIAKFSTSPTVLYFRSLPSNGVLANTQMITQ